MKAIKNNHFFDVELEGEHVEPCPFCGEKASLAHTWTASYWMECNECGAQVSGQFSGEARSRADNLKSARSALQIWNQRAPLSAGEQTE